MADNIMLDIAIGLAMLYLLGALFCTIIQEWIATLFKLRAKNLRAAIGYLIDGKAGEPSATAKEVLNHPLLRIADSASGKLLEKAPSYVAARNFTVSLVQALDLKVTDGPINPATIRTQVQNLPDSMAETRKALLAMLDTAGTDGAKMLAAIDAWYDATMDRASGWYKRNTQVVLLGIGFVLSVAMGADTLAVAQRLSQDHALRASFVALAASTTQSASQINSGTPTDPLAQVRKDLTTAIQDRMAGKPAAGLIGNLPFGPSDWHAPLETFKKGKVTDFFAKVFGCLLTGLALALGAPFWFGLLQFLNAIRASGPKPAPAAPANT